MLTVIVWVDVLLGVALFVLDMLEVCDKLADRVPLRVLELVGVRDDEELDVLV